MAQVKVTLTGDEFRLLKSLDRVVQKEKQVGQAAQKAGKDSAKGSREAERGLKEAGKAREGAFGAGAMGELAKYATGLVSIGGVIGTVTASFRGMDRARREAMENATGAKGGLFSLVTMAKGDQQLLSQMIKEGNQILSEGGAPTPDAAYRMVFSLRSVDAIKEKSLFSRLYPMLPDPADFAASIATIDSTMGKKETGGLRAMVSKLFEASEYTSSLPGPIAEAAARGAVDAKAIGLSDEELVAMVTVISKATKNPERAGTATASLLRFLKSKPEFHGVRMDDILAQIADKNIPLAEQQKYFGREEAAYGYGILADKRNVLSNIVDAMTHAQANDKAGMLIRSIEKNDLLQAIKEADIERGKEQVAGLEYLAPERLEVEAVRSRIRRQNIERGYLSGDERTPMRAFLRDKAAGVAEFFGAGPETIQSVADIVGIDRTATIEMRKAAADLRVAAEKMNRGNGGATLGKPDSDR